MRLWPVGGIRRPARRQIKENSPTPHRCPYPSFDGQTGVMAASARPICVAAHSHAPHVVPKTMLEAGDFGCVPWWGWWVGGGGGGQGLLLVVSFYASMQINQGKKRKPKVLPLLMN